MLRRLVSDWPQIKAPRVSEILRDDYGYSGSVDLVRKRLAALRPRELRPAQRTGYRPGQVMQVDWAEMPTRRRSLTASAASTRWSAEQPAGKLNVTAHGTRGVAEVHGSLRQF